MNGKRRTLPGNRLPVGSVVDGDLISGKHPAFTDELIDLFLKEIETI